MRASRTGSRTGGARPRTRQACVVATLGWVGVATALLGGCGSGGSAENAGIRTFGNLSRNHVATPVSYPEPPPWAGTTRRTRRPGAYDQPVPNEQAVHSMEHGAVWITHRPDLAGTQVEHLRSWPGDRTSW